MKAKLIKLLRFLAWIIPAIKKLIEIIRDLEKNTPQLPPDPPTR